MTMAATWRRFWAAVALLGTAVQSIGAQRHRKLRRSTEERVDGSYLVLLDPIRVVSARAAAARFVAEAAAETTAAGNTTAHAAVVDYVFDGHAALGFGVSHVDAAQIQWLLADDDVLRVEENQPVRVQQQDVAYQQPTDAATWGLDYLAWPRDGYYNWDRNGTGITAYILDTGINLGHVEFAGGRAACAYEVVETGTNCSDGNGHGSHVASVVGGARFGVAKGVTLRAVKVMDSSGTGSMASVVAGIDWVVAERQRLRAATQRPHPAVINLSVGGGVSETLNAAIADAAASGILVVGAAGNQVRTDACGTSPGSAASCLTVGALTRASRQAAFSNVGPCVDLWAPGVAITGADRGSATATSMRTGTSQAAPFVAGLASLYLQGGLSAAAVADALRADARAVDALGRYDSPPLAATARRFHASNATEVTVRFTSFPTPRPTEAPTPPPVAYTEQPTIAATTYFITNPATTGGAHAPQPSLGPAPSPAAASYEAAASPAEPPACPDASGAAPRGSVGGVRGLLPFIPLAYALLHIL